MDAARRVRTPADRCDAFDSWRTRDRVGLSLCGRHCLRGSLLGNKSLGARFRADAHLRNGVRDRAPCCTVVRYATRARTRFLRGEDAAPKRNSHHQHFRACSFRRRSLFRFHLDQFPLSRCAEPESKLNLRRFPDRLTPHRQRTIFDNYSHAGAFNLIQALHK
jgi:hypothetical protein